MQNSCIVNIKHLPKDVNQIDLPPLSDGSQAPVLTWAGHRCRGTAEAHEPDASCKELLIKQIFIDIQIIIFYQDCSFSYLMINMSVLCVCVCVVVGVCCRVSACVCLISHLV